jgi:hypothetical protein
MRLRMIPAGILFPLIFLISGHALQNDFPIMRGPYLGQKPPGMKPEVFAPGIVSTSRGEFNAAFSPDGKEFYYSVNEPGGRETMMFMTRENDRWTPPAPVPFASSRNDCDPFFSQDGSRLYFISTRPKKERAGSRDWDIWYVERTGTGDWSDPKNIGPPVNSDVDEYYVSLTKNGTIYFASNRAGGLGSFDIYRSEFVNGQYGKPENLGDAINTEYLEHDPFIAPDESYLLFTCVDRPGGFGTGDLYISIRRKDGSWTKSKNLGKGFNTSGYDFCPIVSPDGKYFFFTRHGDIYWVRLEAIMVLSYPSSINTEPFPLLAACITRSCARMFAMINTNPMHSGRGSGTVYSFCTDRTDPSNFIWPPIMVKAILVLRISSSGMVMMSLEKTVISASLLGSKVPLMSSSKAA